MRKSMMLLALVAAGAANAGTYSVQQESHCAIVTPGELTQAINKSGKDAGLDLPRGMAIRAELHCTPDASSKRVLYTIRASVEKQVNDGEQQRWAPVAQATGYGTATGSAALLRQVSFTVRDVIRQEP